MFKGIPGQDIQCRCTGVPFFDDMIEVGVDCYNPLEVKAGLDVCRRYGTADATRRGATTLLAEFGGVANHSFFSHSTNGQGRQAT